MDRLVNSLEVLMVIWFQLGKPQCTRKDCQQLFMCECSALCLWSLFSGLSSVWIWKKKPNEVFEPFSSGLILSKCVPVHNVISVQNKYHENCTILWLITVLSDSVTCAKLVQTYVSQTSCCCRKEVYQSNSWTVNESYILRV